MKILKRDMYKFIIVILLRSVLIFNLVKDIKYNKAIINL